MVMGRNKRCFLQILNVACRWFSGGGWGGKLTVFWRGPSKGGGGGGGMRKGGSWRGNWGRLGPLAQRGGIYPRGNVGEEEEGERKC